MSELTTGMVRREFIQAAAEHSPRIAELFDTWLDSVKADALAEAADEMESIINHGDIAESAAIPEGSTGVTEAISARDTLYEEPVEWLRVKIGNYESGAYADQFWAMLAEAWDEGYTSGRSNTMRRMSDEPKAPLTRNPYREEQTNEHD